MKKTLFALLILPMITKVPEVTIPDVSNLTVDEATEKLEKMKLSVNPKVEEEPSDKIEKGKIISTNPKIGKNVKEGTEITLTVSKGVEKIKIEDYKGQNYIKVQTELELQGLKVTIEKQDTDTKVSDADAQNIIGQSVKEGEELEKGGLITLYIPSNKKYYPDMVGETWTLGEARTWAIENNVKLSVSYRETNDHDPNVIIKQSKTTSDEIKANDTLEIMVAKEKKVTTNNNNTTNNSNNTNSSNTTNDNANKENNTDTESKAE